MDSQIHTHGLNRPALIDQVNLLTLKHLTAGAL